MKVFFEFSRSGIKDYFKSFKTVRNYIIDNNHQLTKDLIKNIERNYPKVKLSKKVFNDINEAISKADCIIIEGSIVSLAVSYVLTQSISLSKPVLFITHSKSPDINRNRFAKVINSKLLTTEEYNDYSEIPKIIEKFFNKTKYIKTRFNLVLPNNINSFVTQESKKKDESKTEYIISLIKKEMEKN